MGRVGCAILVDCMVGVAMVGDNDALITMGEGGRYNLLHTHVESLDSFLDSRVNTGVADHIAIREVDDDEIKFLGIDSGHEFLRHLGSRHLGLEVVGGHFRGSHEDTLLTVEGCLTATVEEECDVGILLGLGDMELCLAILREILGESLLHIALGEDDVDTLEGIIIGGHAVELEIGNGVHSILGVLGEDSRQLLGTVVAVIEEDDHMAGTDTAIDILVDDGLEEFVGHTLCIACLDCSDEIGSLLALAIYEHIISIFKALPAMVAVHGVVATDDGGNLTCRLGTMLLHVFEESGTGLGVGVAAIHEAMDEGFVKTIGLGGVAKGIEMVERGVDTAGAAKAHEVDGDIVLLGVGEGAFDLGILGEGTVGDRAVDLHEILIHDASRTDVEMADLGVAHLAVGQTYIFTAGLEFRMGILGHEAIHERGGSVEDGIVLLMVADAIAVKDDQQCFVSSHMLCLKSIFELSYLIQRVAAGAWRATLPYRINNRQRGKAHVAMKKQRGLRTVGGPQSSLFLLFHNLCGSSLFYSLFHATLLDTSLFARQATEIVKFRTAYFTEFVDCDRLDEGGFDGEDTLHADAVGNLANGETLLVAVAADADYDTAILLDTLLVTLLDTVSDCDGVAGLEFIEIFFGSGESLFRNLDQIHCVNLSALKLSLQYGRVSFKVSLVDTTSPEIANRNAKLVKNPQSRKWHDANIQKINSFGWFPIVTDIMLNA